MVFERLSSAIMNNIISGLRGYASNLSLSLEQLEDTIVQVRLEVIKEWFLKGLFLRRDLMLSINCIELDCESLDRCMCDKISPCDELVAHFEIPQILGDFGAEAIDYIGSTDRQVPFVVYTSPQFWRYAKYRKRGKNRPYVFIDVTPNKNNMYDCFVFNAPLLKQVSVVGIFKDPRQLEHYGCCPTEDIDNFSAINSEIEKRVTERFIRYYRQLQPVPTINDQVTR